MNSSSHYFCKNISFLFEFSCEKLQFCYIFQILCRYEGLVAELDGMVEAGFIIPTAEEQQVPFIHHFIHFHFIEGWPFYYGHFLTSFLFYVDCASQ